MNRYYMTTPDLEATEKVLPEPAAYVSYGKNGASFKGHTFYGYLEYAEALPDVNVAAAVLIPAPSPPTTPSARKPPAGPKKRIAFSTM